MLPNFTLNDDVCVGVMGSGEDFVLISLPDVNDDEMEAAYARGFKFCGVLGVTKDGEAGMQPQPGPECLYTCAFASLAFARRIAEMIQTQQQRKQQEAKSVDWLNNLWAMNDPRTDAYVLAAALCKQMEGVH